VRGALDRLHSGGGSFEEIGLALSGELEAQGLAHRIGKPRDELSPGEVEVEKLYRAKWRPPHLGPGRPEAR
jgi:hypothetical protein